MIAETSLDSLLKSIQKTDSLTQSQIEQFNQALNSADEKFLTPTLKVFFKAKNYPNVSLEKTTKILRSKVGDCEDWLHVEIFQVQDTIDKGKINKGINRARKLINTKECKTDKQHYILLQAIGSGNYYLQRYDSAIYYFREAIDISSKRKDTVSIITNNVNIGSSYHGLGAYRTALYYFQEALEVSKHYTDFDTRYVKNNMSAILITIEEYDEAASYILEQFPQKNERVKFSDINTLICLNSLRCHSSKIPDSIRTISYNYLEKYMNEPNPYQNAMITEVAKYYYDNNQRDKALNLILSNENSMMKDTALFLDFVIELYSNIDTLKLSDQSLKKLFDYANNSSFSKFESIIHYMIKNDHWVKPEEKLFAQYHNKVSDFISSNDSLVKRDYSIYNDIKKKEFQISSLDKKVKKSERENQLLIIAIISLALIVGLISTVFILYRKQTSYKFKLNEAREASLVKQKRLAEAKSKEAKTKEELVSIKNNVFKELLPFFDELNQNTKEMLPELPKSTKIKYLTFQENLERLKKLLNLKEKVNSDVTTQEESLLSKDKLELTDREIRIARLITSGMSSKEIAVTLNRKASYVNNLRSNLRKKLNLDHNQSLEEELRKLNL
ncbi:transcriptional regulator [Salibacter halophilus]|uniref:LuxR family transcriptional regulator n=1 Tax=Salibacter halophilus TaxID=1803916 RepID=A0A6N6M3D5_9FLAO|nr:LuxR family transcriptional regulator [Salibacter halophilus]KAB1063655.1 LuxR family transcriptional regulator [Salibacter halophilus]